MQPYYLIIHHIRHHGHNHKNHLIYFNKINHINPKDPAVIPTVTKNPNSKRSLEPGGIDVNKTARGIIEGQKINRLYMQ